ncbi:E3 ubiquitin-protein ligase TRIM35-like isoform X2 [Brachyhypopomus gauderio]|uniref:E3 ubiquitin-protein ligase TRIM35-like isoform X2 n=1 Tax=Brachyhypopomus gauderio TaxID=698409 RepID=UPI0040410299
MMALSHTSLEEHLKCSICLEIFKDPVVLTCSHSFCRTCIERTWHLKEMKKCPLCSKRMEHEHINNLVLKDTCESFMKVKKCRMEEPGVVCLLHTEKQWLFCVDDQQLVCSQCVDQDHQNHNFCSISKAAEKQREIEGPLQVLQAKLVSWTSKKCSYVNLSSNLKKSVQQVVCQVKTEFEKLHQFLREEEQTRIAALKEEEEQKNRRMKATIAKIEDLCSALSAQINNITDAMRVEDSLFVNNFKETIKRAKYTVPDSYIQDPLLVDESKLLKNLRYRVWQKMKDICPNCPPTAPCVAASTPQQLPLPGLNQQSLINPTLTSQKEQLTGLTSQQLRLCETSVAVPLQQPKPVQVTSAVESFPRPIPLQVLYLCPVVVSRSGGCQKDAVPAAPCMQ